MPTASPDRVDRTEQPLSEFFEEIERSKRGRSEFTLAEVTEIIRIDRDAGQ